MKHELYTGKYLGILLSTFWGILVLGNSCSAPLIPKASEPSINRQDRSNAQLMDSLRQEWAMLHNVDLSPEDRQRVIARYNHDLLLLIRRYRVDYVREAKAGNAAYVPSELEVVRESSLREVPLREIYSDIVPAVDVRTHSLDEHYFVSGLGVALVGVIPPDKIDKTRSHDNLFNIHTRGTVRTLTALIEFPEKSKPCVRFIPRHRQETVRVGRLLYPLAADFSAPIEIYWNLTRIKDDRFLGLLRPQELRDVTGLSCIEGYDPEKIPVILTHGLLSSAGTFDNLVNRLISDPLIRKHYQFWYFNYPTGVAWTVSAQAYRKALSDVRKRVDPRHVNKNWDRMIVVGHSMGGLITHYSQCEQPWLLLRNMPHFHSLITKNLQGNHAVHAGKDQHFDSVRQVYFFHPVRAGMVMYLATPHRGAPLARYRIVRALINLIRLPENLVNEVVSIVTLQEDNLVTNPRQITEWLTSVNQLSPDSYSISGLRGLKVRDVPTFSVIGDRGRGDTPHSSDGVVPYWSSHIPWGEEVIVPSDHSVQDVPETSEYMKKVLKAYLSELGIHAG